jgi:fumarate hydratase subunit alpha
MKIREIDAALIRETVRDLCMSATTELGEDVVGAVEAARAEEPSELGQDILGQILKNADIARQECISLCQDAGMAVVFVALGQDVHISGGDLQTAIDSGVREGYRQGHLRPSTLDPITRVNFGDNTPAIIHMDVVPGNKLMLDVLPKGFGGENMSRVVLFHPAVGIAGAKDFVVERVREAGANACPPLLVGVGIGGNLEMAAKTAKRSLLRPLGQAHPRPDVAEIEADLLARINRLGIGPQGLGGRTTALAVHVETYPTHIGSLPVAVNLQCHSHRHRSAEL